MGLDDEDLSEYGFDLRSITCGGKCQSYNEFKTKGQGHISRLYEKGVDQYRKATCHPAMQKHVVPVVEFIWKFFPVNLVFGA